MFGSAAARFPGAGALGCLTMAFIAGHKWKAEKACCTIMYTSVRTKLSLYYINYNSQLFPLGSEGFEELAAGEKIIQVM